MDGSWRSGSGVTHDEWRGRDVGEEQTGAEGCQISDQDLGEELDDGISDLYRSAMFAVEIPEGHTWYSMAPAAKLVTPFEVASTIVPVWCPCQYTETLFGVTEHSVPIT